MFRKPDTSVEAKKHTNQGERRKSNNDPNDFGPLVLFGQYGELVGGNLVHNAEM